MFVAGVFSWDLWHWDCWLNQRWLVRGALPTFVATLVFARAILGLRWWVACVLAVLLIPVALTLSIAWSVACGQWVLPHW